MLPLNLASLPSKDPAALLLGQLHSGDETLYLRANCPWHAARRDAETFIAQQFTERHAAQVTHFMPVLLTLESTQGDILAAAGLRTAAQQKLFVERYMDFPIERIVASKLQQPTRRQQVVEIGNLASARQGASRYLFVALTALLIQWDLPWLSFTGTRQVLNVFARLGLNPISVCPADKSRLGHEADQWGSYYDNDPQVMVGDVRGGYATLLKLNVFAALRLQLAQGAADVLSA